MAGPRRLSRAAASACVLAALALLPLGRSCYYPCSPALHFTSCSDSAGSHALIKVRMPPHGTPPTQTDGAEGPGAAQPNGCCIDTAFECPTTCTSRETTGEEGQARVGNPDFACICSGCPGASLTDIPCPSDLRPPRGLTPP